jgi:pancreatic triacylglycerol lipase
LVHLDAYSEDAETLYNPEQDIIWMLFTSANPEVGHRLPFNDAAALAASNFNPANPTRISIHGWNSPMGLNEANRAAYMSRGGFNYIAMDWTAGSNTLNFITARNRVGITGATLARFVEFLNSAGGMNFNSLSIIGHSLGAHVAGMCGKNVQNGRIQTIIGLDPGAPLFSINEPGERLDFNDAQYVEGIVTNGGGAGMFEPISQATFYPNGGQSQPGCGIDVSGSCAHSRSHEFFAETVTTTAGFWARRCASFAEIQAGVCTVSGPNMAMGGDPSNHGRGAEGVYALTTNGNPPFAQGPV